LGRELAVLAVFISLVTLVLAEAGAGLAVSAAVMALIPIMAKDVAVFTAVAVVAEILMPIRVWEVMEQSVLFGRVAPARSHPLALAIFHRN
jgi:hypothetical protein